MIENGSIYFLGLVSFLSYLSVRLFCLKFLKSDPQDKWSHICDSNLIKKSSSFPAFHHQFLPVMPFTYPWGIALLLNFFTTDINRRFIIMNNCLSAAFNSLIFVWILVEINFQASILYFSVSLISPSIVSPWNGLSGINGRNIGAIVCSLFFFMVFQFSGSIYTLLILSLLMVLVAAWFSKFAVQTIIIFGSFTLVLLPFTSFLTPNIVFALFLGIFWIFLAYFGALGKFTKRILKGSIQHSKFYYKFLQQKSVMVKEKNLSFKTLWAYLMELKIDNIIRKFVFFPFVRIHVFNPALIMIGYFSLVPLSSNNHLVHVPFLCLVGFLISIILTHDKLKFIGEADRYFDFAVGTFSVAYVCANIDLQNLLEYLLFIFLFSSNLILFTYLLIQRKKLTKSTDQKCDLEVVNWLTKNSPNKTIVTWPTTLSDKFVALIEGEFKFLALHTNADPSSDKISDLEALYSLQYPYPKLAGNDLKTFYNVGYCVVDKRFRLNMKAQGDFISLLEEYLGSFEIIFENEQFLILLLE